MFLLLLGGACADAGQPASSPTESPGSGIATPSTAAAETVEPSVPAGLTPAKVTRVVDGDTIEVEIDGQAYKVRYIGIDTPETVHPSKPVQCFGPEASARNKELVEGKTVGVEKDVSETDDFGRLLRYVWVGSEMVNATLVSSGYAQVATYPPDVKYQQHFLDLQRQARDAGLGLWGAGCESATPMTARPPQGGGCEYSTTGAAVIKGNISQSTGEKIYHVPGQDNYENTVIDESAGERWFCTEAEAVAAGWRKAKK
jgi:micrococcal nuclease